MYVIRPTKTHSFYYTYIMFLKFRPPADATSEILVLKLDTLEWIRHSKTVNLMLFFPFVYWTTKTAEYQIYMTLENINKNCNSFKRYWDWGNNRHSIFLGIHGKNRYSKGKNEEKNVCPFWNRRISFIHSLKI